ncbi:hypothetical protein [Nonomuraea sp. NPDC049695]|uniref:hypothetical protein n=1 Tax=Nonomuraea sp. NPDC049695 TaxID=3154734 RepID=UPI0034219501
MNQLVPLAGATKDSRCPQTVLTSDGRTLTVIDSALDISVRVTPASLYRYDRLDGAEMVQGVAALDADGLVLLDLPAQWYEPDLADFARKAGIPLMDARSHSSARVRAVLAGRAPGWKRLRGLPPPSPAKWRKPVAICGGVVGLGLMVYLASLGMWSAWRAISSMGRFLLDVLEVKWLMVVFSPALLVLRPVFAKVRRWQVRRGAILLSADGSAVKGDFSETLEIFRGLELVTTLRIGVSPGAAFGLLLYRYEDLTGLFILDRHSRPVYHLPGRWSPEHVHLFAERHHLFLAVHGVSREEYLNLTKIASDAMP